MIFPTTLAAAGAPPLLSWANAVALLTLTALEVVLGIDNIVFIAILSGTLPESQRPRARQIGLALALVTRILLLATIFWIVGLGATPLFTLPILDHALTWKDLILIIGGLFLIYKSTIEIHHKVEGGGQDLTHPGAAPGDLAATPTPRPRMLPAMPAVIAQILLIDMVFSLDSVITAVGMAQAIQVMIAAVIISVGIMLIFAGRISRFIERHPTMKMLALAFLLLIGVVLVADGLGRHVEKGYIYFAMAFSLGVETLNLVARRKKTGRATDRQP